MGNRKAPTPRPAGMERPEPPPAPPLIRTAVGARDEEIAHLREELSKVTAERDARTRAIARWSVCCGWNCGDCIDTLTEFIDVKDQEAARAGGVPCDR